MAASRPGCVVSLTELTLEPRPKLTPTPGVAAEVASLGDATGLTQMGVHLRVVRPGNAGTHRHFHDVEEEWAFVLSGTGTVRISELRLPVRPGSFVAFPPGPRPHHFLAAGDEPLVLLEGGERRPQEDTFWYPDVRRMARGRRFLDAYEAPPEEPGNPGQCVHVSDVESRQIQHDVEPRARRSVRALSVPSGLVRQALHEARVASGDLSTARHTHMRTDEWLLILEGRALARVGAEEFAVSAGDFIGYPAGSAPHLLEAQTELVYLVGGQRDPDDIVIYPDAGLQRVRGALMPLQPG